MWRLIFVLVLLLGSKCFSQNQSVIEVNGDNWTPIFPSSFVYIDSTNSRNVYEINDLKNSFKRINHPASLVLKKQPNTVWVHTYIRNTGEPMEYWLGLYSQMDSLVVYRINENGITMLNRSEAMDYRKLKNPKIRFHCTPIKLGKNEVAELYLKIRNGHHFQNIYADFTTPVDNLTWETGFYLEIGFVVGISLIISLLSFILGFMIWKKVFLQYAVYLLIIAIIVIREELFFTIIKIPFLYNIIFKTNTLFLLMIAMGLGMKIILSLIEKDVKYRFRKLLNGIFSAYIIIGIALSFYYYFDYANAIFSNRFYNLIWDLCIVLTVASLILELGMLFLYFWNRKLILWGVIVCLTYGFLNPVTYFFNYSRILQLYEISHPNYFYFVLFFEIVFLGIAISYKYSRTKSDYIEVLRDKLKLEEENRVIQEQQDEKIKISILESGNHMLKNLSKELHDDIGQKLSVINFSIENLKVKNPENEELSDVRGAIVEISDSLRDLSHWLNDFSLRNISLRDIFYTEINRLNKIDRIHFDYKTINCDDQNSKTSLEENVILYRCFQECINNILKHSQATEVQVTLDCGSGTLLKIKDNGIGFNTGKLSGIGIKNLKDRSKIIGYDCVIMSEPNKGTEIIFIKND